MLNISKKELCVVIKMVIVEGFVGRFVKRTGILASLFWGVALK